jgi:aldose 1-epimerase
MKLAPLAALCAFSACSTMTADTPTFRWFGSQKDGRPAMVWTLRTRGLEVDVTDYGATLVAVRTPDRGGFVDDIVLGFDDVTGYQSDANQYFGCTTGRVCNRIAKGEFVLDGYPYVLARNNGPNHLHGGASRSFDKVHWEGTPVADGGAQGVRFSYHSRDGEEGYPGNLHVTVTYWVMPGPTLKVITEARTDKRTPVNITNHAYWNLEGAGSATVLDHELQVEADTYTPTDDTLIPTGAIASVERTALDFRKPQPIGLRLHELTGTPTVGYDHNLVLRGSGMRQVATLRAPGSGRWLEIHTTEPALQVYSGNWLRGQTGKGGKAYAQRSAVCLETQHYPDSVHHAHFPNTILEPGQAYRTETMWKFGAP